MSFNLDELMPEIPSFTWEGKKYTANKIIFAMSTRIKYSQLSSKYVQDQLALVSINKQLHKEFEGTDASIKTQKEKIVGHLKRKERTVNAGRKKLFEFIDKVFPGTKALLIDNDEFPEWAVDEISQWIACKIMNYPYIPKGSKYSHDEAEKMLDYMIKEQARKEHQTPAEMYEEVEGKVFKKK